MKHYSILLALALSILGFSSCSQELELIDSGKNNYVIVTSKMPTMMELKAAKELQNYLHKISDVWMPIVEDTEPPTDKEISIGNTNRIIPLAVSSDELGEDGFYIRTDNKRVCVIGGNNYGILYGVNELLENYLGCRKYTKNVEFVPRKTKVTLPSNIDDWQVPSITSRNMLYVCANDDSFFEWLRLTQTPRSGVDHGKWGFWVHTFGTLVPEHTYFDSHPEYYTLTDRGERVPSQLCLTNPEVLEVLWKELDGWMAKKPEAIYWSVSQNDNYNYCKCEECLKICEEEGSPAGLMIRFINKVAERYPDKVISTLAYQYTRKAPLHVKPVKNVNIMFCNIECNRSKPIPLDETSADFMKDMDDWAKISDNILLWDYMIQFSNLYTPFPNLRTLQPNMQYFVRNNVTSVFSQGNPEPAGEMCHLRAYIAAKLLWNPYCDVEAVMDDFLTGYYGNAGKYIKEYINLLHDNLERSGEGLSIFGNALTPVNGYLSPANLDSYQSCFDRAEAAVAGQPELLERVQEARLPLLFTELEQANLMPIGERGFFESDANGELNVSKKYTNKLDRFIEGCRKNDTRRLCEWMTTVDEYQEEMTVTPQQYQKFLSNGNKALHKSARISLPLTDYKAEGLTSITDGILGARNYDENWIGFKHDNFDIIIDLEEQQEIKEVDIRFIQSILDRLILPKRISIETSLDGNQFTCVSSVNHNMNREKNYMTKVYEAKFNPRNARYVKLKVDVISVCPLWHRDAGNDIWTMFDEVAIR